MATTAVKKPQSALAHLIPDAKFAVEYISRRIENVTDLDLLRYCKAATANVMIYGPTGPGKTSMVLAYCAKDRLPLVTVQCHGAVDPATFWGGLVLNPATNQYEWQDSEVTQIIKHGGVLYLDEVNFLPSKVAAVFHGLLDKRRAITILEKGNEVVEAHPDLQIVVAYNPDYEGTKPLNAAFKNRFKVKVRLDYDANVEAALLCLPIIQELAAKLRASHKAGDLETPISTNMLLEFETLAIDLSYGFAVSNFINAFTEDERQSVKEVFDLYADRIRDQLKEVAALADAAD
jgi:MoxR-like ATPase